MGAVRLEPVAVCRAPLRPRAGGADIRNLRAGLEYCRVKGERPGAPALGFDPRSDGSTITAELRYGF